MDRHAGERSSFTQSCGEAERDEAQGRGLEVERRKDDRGIDDAGLQRAKREAAAPPEQRRSRLSLARSPTSSVEKDSGDVVLAATEMILPLRFGNRLEAGLAGLRAPQSHANVALIHLDRCIR